MKFSVPDRPTLDGLEAKWSKAWESQGTYKYRSDRTKPAFSIDTPPPTVSGSLHVGHVLSYTHTDIVARFKRMMGFDVFYPIGWDDNGVPTERRVQNYYGVRCEPDIAYQPGFEPPSTPSKEQIPISRRNFIELCNRLTIEDEMVFEELWRTIGLSVDWSKTYTTVGNRSQRISQTSFVRLARQGHLYSQESPTLWDVDFRTAVSQAELEDRESPGAYHRVRFTADDGTWLDIETTRPELIPACVGLVAHPEDDRFKEVFGKEFRSPLFGVPVKVFPHPLADPEKGSGIAMVCTFGDVTDVIWWRELGLALRTIVGRDGRFASEVPFGTQAWPTNDPTAAATQYKEIAQKAANGARRRIVEMLVESGALIGEPKAITHPVKFYEKGDRPLEIVASRQWFIKTMDKKERLVDLGRQVNWVPQFMRIRYENWVEGLNSDWNISRQRYFGIPIPVWYPNDSDGNPIYTEPIFAAEETLPIDPQVDTPVGFSESSRNMPNGFTADPDVMDTWATSSLSPQIATGWLDDETEFERLFPMDLRPQGQDIIRTWLFYTMLRSELGHGVAPWRSTVISGFVLDPERKKMSKSKGNVVTPMPLVAEHGADALRYWSAGGRPGVDTAAEPGQMKVGRRLAIKILNATKFVFSIAGQQSQSMEAIDTFTLSPVDAAFLGELSKLIESATGALESYDHTRAIESIERLFWTFCDDFIELLKLRAYAQNDGSESPVASDSSSLSARVTLLTGISILLRLLAPFLPFATEEAWSWWSDSSIHNQQWPTGDEPIAEASRIAQSLYGARLVPQDPLPHDGLLSLSSDLLSTLRRIKTEAKVSVKTPITSVTLQMSAETNGLVELIHDDLMRSCVILNPIKCVISNTSDEGVELIEAELALPLS